jgi:hypothetical protein
MVIYPYFDVILYNDIRSDLMSVPILMDGNKEIYENIHASALYTNRKLLEIYNEALSVLEEHYDDEQSIKQKYNELINKKLTEIEALLNYADLKMFSKGLQQKKDNLQLQEVEASDLNIECSRELAILEKVFGEEITLLFYSNLSKESDNYLLQFYPPHSVFLEHENKMSGSVVSSIVPPRSTLLSILHSDNDIKVWFRSELKIH